MAEVRITKRDYFEQLREIVEGAGVVNADELVAFIDKQVAQIDAKNAKAKERAAKVKAQGDGLRAEVEAVLTEDFQTIDAITAQVEGEDVTRNKVVARLTQLVDAGIAVKEAVKVEGASRKVMCYKVAGEATEVEDAEQYLTK